LGVPDLKITIKFISLLLTVLVAGTTLSIAIQDESYDWQNMSIAELDETLDQIQPGSHDFEVAERYFDWAIEDGSGLTDRQRLVALYGKGRVLSDNDEDYEGAIKYFDRALSLDPSCCQCLDQKGWAQFSLEKYESAFASVDEALKICPENAHAWNNKGIYYYLQNEDYQKALECFDKAIESDPNFGDAWYDKYKAHLKLGQNREAEVALKKSTKCGVSEQSSKQEG
jgi:tetratricopeptide (TPR) repeat protein